MVRIAAGLAALALAGAAGCQTTMSEGSASRATATLKPTQGSKTFGDVSFEQIGGKVRVTALVQGLKPGAEHGFHIHEVGDCSDPRGMSTKGHFNPHGKPHGQQRSMERHAGDLPSLSAGMDGRARLQVDVDIISVSPGPASVIGRGMIVHADPDDYKTQPTGNAGARIACGVIRAG